MGANQSTGSGGDSLPGAVNGLPAKTCYYELLNIQRDASHEDIKKAYHRKALELHPDRNLGNVKASTQQFAEVQAAYEVLSDPQERAWYDSHRETILNGSSDIYDGDHERDVGATSAQDIIKMLRKFNGQFDFTDSPNGFFGLLRTTFASLALEEEKACEWEQTSPVTYPSFGSASDEYQTHVRFFYSVWTNFVTQKSFAWKDTYRYSDAPDRRIRRLMEKENKRLREEGIREFNDAVRSLVAFVRKRDPRVQISKETEIERQRALREATAAQASRSRIANQAKAAESHGLPSWMTSSEPAELESSEEEKVSAPRTEFECIICKKVFKSEKQYDVHERSKKHVKAVRQLRSELQQNSVEPKHHDSLERGSLQDDSMSDAVYASGEQSMADRFDSDRDSDSETETKGGLDGRHRKIASKMASFDDSSISPILSSSNCSLDSMESEAQHSSSSKPDFLGEPRASTNETLAVDAAEDDSSPGAVATLPEPKLGKAKAKRAKKAAKEVAVSLGKNHQCVTCQATFPSKTRLFSHIKDFRHAQPVPSPPNKGKGRKGR